MTTAVLRSVFRVSPIFALLWEQWRMTRGAIFFAVAATLGVAYPLYIADNQVHFQVLNPPVLASFAYLIGLVVVAIFFAVDTSAVGEVRLGIPVRQHLMPIRRQALVAGHFFYRMVMMAILAALLGRILDALFGHDALPYQEMTMLAVCALAYVLAISWTVGRHGVSVGVLAALLLVWPLYLISIIFAEYTFGKESYASPVLFAGLSSVIALRGALRRETAAPEGRAVGVAKLIDRALSFAPARLDTAESALWWFEWRRRGLVLPTLALVITIPYALVASIAPVMSFLFNYQTSTSVLSAAALAVERFGPMAFAIAVVPLASFLGGAFYMMLDRRDRESSGALTGLRAPVTNRALGRTRFTVSFAAVATTLGVVAILIAALNVMAWSAGVPEDRWLVVHELHKLGLMTPLGVLAAAFLVVGYATFCWALTFLPLFVAGTAVSLAGMVFLGYNTAGAYAWYCGALALVFVAVTLYFGRAASVHRSIGRRGLVTCGVVTLICAVTAPAWLRILGIPQENALISVSLWLLLVFVPPLAFFFELDWIHRQRGR